MWRLRCQARLASATEEDDAIIGLFDQGLPVPVFTPHPLPDTAETVITAEAGLDLDPQLDFRAQPLVREGDQVAQGAPILRDRRRPECVITAPMTGRIAEVEVGVGRRLGSLILYAEERDDRHVYDPRSANEEITTGSDSVELRALLQETGLWMRLRARPFGRVPAPDTSPAAIFIMAADTRPLAPDPRLILVDDNAGWLTLGLRALEQLSKGSLHFCQDRGPDIVHPSDRITIERVGPLHPGGLAGLCIHRRYPARPDRQVWDIDVEDVVAIGQVLAEGRLPATRLVSVAGPGMRETRLVRCQPGADLRELCHGYMAPGLRTILSGSVLEGRESRWLGLRDRQVSVIARPSARPPRNWLGAALRLASRPEPVIPTAALEQALGSYGPAMALLRALSVGDDEAVVELGGLSLLEEDLALVDYTTAAVPRFSRLLRASLDRIEDNL